MRLPVLAAVALLAAGCGGEARRLDSTTTAPQAPPVAVAKPHRPRPVRRLLTLPRILPRRTVQVPILMYHRIDLVKPTLPPITQRLTVDPRAFAAEMEWLKRNGYHAISDLQLYDALEHGAPLPPRPVMITFDDGYRDVLGKAAPVLRRLHWPATAFIITDRVSGPDPSFLTWGMLRRLERDGIAIGDHTVTHADLAALPPAQVRWQLVDSRRLLQRRLGAPVQWLAYPAGRFDPAVVAIARAAGYVLAVTTQPGVTQSAAQPLELHRDEVLDTTGVGGLAGLLGR